MFLVRNKGKIHLWSNKKSDDFLRFVPVQLKATQSELEIFVVDEEKEADLMKEPNLQMINPLDYGKKLKVWPYQEHNGKQVFQGISDEHLA